MNIFQSLRAWAMLVLNQGSTPLNIPIIEAFQNAPAPLGPYIAIEYTSNAAPFGSHTSIFNNETLTTEHTTDWSVNAVFWHVNGDGDALRYLKQSIAMQDVKDLLSLHHLSYLGAGEIIPSPRLVGDAQWVRESSLTVRLAVATRVVETTNPVEDAGVTKITGDS